MRTNSNIRISPVEWLALALAIIGAINWGLVGIGGFINTNLNLVNLLLGAMPTAEYLVYVIVGLAGLYLVWFGYQLYEAPRETAGAEAKPAR